MNVIKGGNVKEIEASKMSMQKNGFLVLFSGKYDAMLLNLNDSAIRIYNNIGKKSREITTCQWSKHGDNIAFGMDKICKIYDCDMNKLQSLKCHITKISSIDWHPSTSYHIISSSYDTSKSICIWDIRKPVALIAKKDVCVIQQVKWHKSNSSIFATSSDSDIQMWDQRNMSSPVYSVLAHESYVSDFDWLPREDYSLVSCGQYDQKLKLWNFTEYNQSLKCQVDEEVSMSHCKLNQTGNQLITLTLPENGPENHFVLWDTSSAVDIQKKASTYLTTSTIVDFEWQSISTDKQQIISLHKNFEYKIWDVDSNIISIKKLPTDNFVKNLSTSNDRFYLSPSPLSLGEISNNITTVSSETFTKTTNDTLDSLASRYSDSNLAIKSRMSRIVNNDVDSRIQKEFERLTNSIQIAYEKVLDERSVIAHLNLVNARCSIMFTYQRSGPEGVFLDASVLPEKSDRLRKQNIDELEKILKNTANKNLFSISKCIDAALDYINKLSSRVNIRSVRSTKDSGSGSNFFCNLPDVKVPFPRTCGASFSPSGHLVCFVLPPGHQNKFSTTPRSFVDIVKHSNSSGSGKDFLYGYNVVNSKVPSYRTSKQGSRKNKMMDSSGDVDYSSRMHSLSSLQKHNFSVYIYNAQKLSLFCPELAKNYSIDVSNIEKMCEQNAACVSESIRKDLTEFWQYCIILATATRPSSNELSSKRKPWPSQMFGRHMCNMWIEHFKQLFDIQSCAMLIIIMMAIDSRFETDFETRYNYSMIAGGRKNMFCDYNQDNQTVDNNSITSLPSCVNLIYDGVKLYRVYDDKSNSAVIISDGSVDSGKSRFYSNSVSEVDHQVASSSMKRPDTFPEMIIRHRESCRLIDPSKLQHYGLILLHYARILSAQNLLSAATKICNKILPTTFFNNSSIKDQFSVRLLNMSSDTVPSHCTRIDDQRICIDYSQRTVNNPVSLSSRYNHYNQEPCVKSHVVFCSICRLTVQGLLSVCARCHHGGHTNHITAWFTRPNSPGLCPTGCGCQCSSITDNIHELFAAMAV